MQKNEQEHPVFTIGRRYFNRRGEYEVLKIDGDKLYIKYDDGTEQQASALTQARIAQNMAIETSIVSPYPVNLQSRNYSFFFTVGFLAVRATMLEAIVPPHALDGFTQDYFRIKGVKPKQGQPGLYVHRPEADKWGCELRVTFRATNEKAFNLDFGPHVHCVADPANPGLSWRINNNGFWWRLLKFGFEMGPIQDASVIRSRVPVGYKKQFDLGHNKAG